MGLLQNLAAAPNPLHGKLQQISGFPAVPLLFPEESGLYKYPVVW